MPSHDLTMKKFAIISFVLGLYLIFGSLLVMLPISESSPLASILFVIGASLALGPLLALIGIFSGAHSLKKQFPSRTLAIAGITFNILFLVYFLAILIIRWAL